jgi:hypothetical protein
LTSEKITRTSLEISGIGTRSQLFKKYITGTGLKDVEVTGTGGYLENLGTAQPWLGTSC